MADQAGAGGGRGGGRGRGGFGGGRGGRTVMSHWTRVALMRTGS